MRKSEIGIRRRTFLAASGGGTLFMGLGSLLAGPLSAAELERTNLVSGAQFAPTVWFDIDANGAVVINIAKAEMGQHVGTALARIIADELGADWSRISINHVDTDPKWGYMVTGGSWSVFTSFTLLSQAGAAGRKVLIDAGAEIMGVDPAACHAEQGQIISGDQSLSFADIVSGADLNRQFSAEELEAMPVKSPADRQLIGKDVSALDIPEKSRGEAVYGLDVELPGMVYASPLIPPTRYGSRIRSVDDSAAKSIAGYLQTLQIQDPSDTIQGWALVIAENLPAAQKASKQIHVDWAVGATAEVTEDGLFARGAELINDRGVGALVVKDGNVDRAQEEAAKTLSSSYRTHSVLHFALEPQNALVEYVDDVFHIHAGNQWQSLILPVLSNALSVPESQIVIHQYYLGGGFGRRLYGDQMIPAALAARELGRPVKLVFERADDSRFDCVRSPSVSKLEASIDSANNLTGLDHAVAAGWPTLSMAPGFLADGIYDSGKYDTFSISGADHWYNLPNHRVRAINNDLAQKTFLPGWLRAVGPGWIGWGVECFMDELADELQKDPIEFRLGMLNARGKNAGVAPSSIGGAARLAAVLKDVAKRSGWGRELPAGEALGVAIGSGQERTMPTWTACVVHLVVDSETSVIQVKKIWQSIDCGTVVDPIGAMAQAEGATLWGLSLALHEGTEIERGEVRDQNLDSYRPLRMADVPDLDIRFIENSEFPTGLGEPPLIAVAPAIGNAIYAATGKRVRDLPIRL